MQKKTGERKRSPSSLLNGLGVHSEVEILEFSCWLSFQWLVLWFLFFNLLNIYAQTSVDSISHFVQQKYDAMVADTTIILNRSMLVDFTLPYTESGVQMIVPMRETWSKSLWVLMKPIEPRLWVAILVVFLFTGLVIWLVEHKESRYFGGSTGKQLVNIVYFNFQALFSVPRGKLNRIHKRMTYFIRRVSGNEQTFVVETIIFFSGFRT